MTSRGHTFWPNFNRFGCSKYVLFYAPRTLQRHFVQSNRTVGSKINWNTPKVISERIALSQRFCKYLNWCNDKNCLGFWVLLSFVCVCLSLFISAKQNEEEKNVQAIPNSNVVKIVAGSRIAIGCVLLSQTICVRVYVWSINNIALLFLPIYKSKWKKIYSTYWVMAKQESWHQEKQNTNNIKSWTKREKKILENKMISVWRLSKMCVALRTKTIKFTTSLYNVTPHQLQCHFVCFFLLLWHTKQFLDQNTSIFRITNTFPKHPCLCVCVWCECMNSSTHVRYNSV